MSCPVNRSCAMHANAAEWLRVGDLDQLAAHQDVFWVLRKRAWRHCTCDLFNRIMQAIGVKRERMP